MIGIPAREVLVLVWLRAMERPRHTRNRVRLGDLGVTLRAPARVDVGIGGWPILSVKEQEERE